MKSLNELLDAIKERRNLETDSALAAALGVKRQTVSNWRQGRNTPDAVACATIAGLSGEPLARVIGLAGEQRAISQEEKAVWRKLAATAMTALCAIGFAFPLLGKAHQIDVSPYSSGGESGAMHIMFMSGWATGPVPMPVTAVNAPCPGRPNRPRLPWPPGLRHYVPQQDRPSPNAKDATTTRVIVCSVPAIMLSPKT